MNVLVLDPGERVGWARAEIDEHGNWSRVRHGITPLWDMADAVAKSQDVQGYSRNEDESWGKAYDTIVVETWRLYGSHAQQMIGSTFPSVQFIGAIKLICRLSGTQYVEQAASQKRVGIARLEVDYPEWHALAIRPVAHDDGHDQDALMHLAAFTFKRFGPRPQDWMVD